MLRKLSLVAVAAASLGVAALAPTSASAWGGCTEAGMEAGTAVGIAAGVGAVPASTSAVRPITDTAMAMAAATYGNWFRRHGDRAGAW
jgi:hypothetical protein